MAALQARAIMDADGVTERDFAEVASRNRAQGKSNPYAQLVGDFAVDKLMTDPYVVAPLRKHACPPISDGAAAVILAAGDAALELCERPAWIRGIEHRIETHAFGARNLARSSSAALAAERAGAKRDKIDVAELHASFASQEIVLRRSLGLSEDTVVNPSGGPLAANPVMAAGLIRIGEAAERIRRGDCDRALAHATSGHCLQQNLVCVLEGA
jgi:acetyl-CoA acetyltransferase